MAQEFDLAPQQMIALRMLGRGPRKMSELANSLFCDNSNVTGSSTGSSSAAWSAARRPRATAA